MSTQTLDRTEQDHDETTESPRGKTSTAKKSIEPRSQGLGRLRSAWQGLNERAEAKKPAKPRGRFSLLVWSVFFRGLVLIADYMLVYITVTGTIPIIAAWLHQQSGAAQGDLTTSGTVALWLMPLGFFVVVLAVAELVIMRGMWRWAARMITGIHETREAQSKPASGSGAPQTQTNRRKKNNRKRSK